MRELKGCGLGVLVKFYNLYGLEDEEFLHPLNDTDLFCVHIAILPQVNRCLEEFTESWNNHSLSSIGDLTPEALFTIGLSNLQGNIISLQKVTSVESVWYRMEWRILQWSMFQVHQLISALLCNKLCHEFR